MAPARVADLEVLQDRLGQHFRRSGPRRRVGEYRQGLLTALERKNGWTLAEQAGELCPYDMQRLLNQANWDANAVQHEVRSFTLEHLADNDGVLIVDETGFFKKGVRPAGVQRQYAGTTGRSITVGWRSSWPTPPQPGGHWPTASCTCRAPGRRVRHGRQTRGLAGTSSSRPNLPRPRPCRRGR
ncbi:hypothetical protein FOE67_02645 [Streptomyces calidiresistens]|uniref:Transposase IS701-like DDE domain-containing protein n=1 Tax=Streptomyces calidiresistens TaxID=1485586 RepID=A0A7W3T030_9ACTN|nr:hypothetical protein [Streptomyces calidiresistens]